MRNTTKQTYSSKQILTQQHITFTHSSLLQILTSSPLFVCLQVAFQGHPLGYTILGPRGNINKLSRDDLKHYIKNHYTGGELIVDCVVVCVLIVLIVDCVVVLIVVC
jgi:hypothetical protein